jgi:hypothetical protein
MYLKKIGFAEKRAISLQRANFRFYSLKVCDFREIIPVLAISDMDCAIWHRGVMQVGTR